MPRKNSMRMGSLQ
nr:unnamed protein product [Callosobruchus chinensis]CAH7762974.1 unnamed protein product [Callosobruchus chinensis]